MGGLWFSLDIRSKIDAQLKEYSGKIKGFQKDIQNCQDAINIMSADLSKMAKGSDAWNRQREAIASIFRLVDSLIDKTRIYENALGRVQNIATKFNKGGLVAPIVTNNRLDPKPIEQAIERYEKIQNILKRINELQGQRATKRLDAQTGLGTSLAREVYQKRMQEVDAGINKLKADLKDLGASGMSMSGVKSQLDSLYGVLVQFEQGNRRAADSTRQERDEEQRRARTLKDARIWFEQIAAAMSREEAQERRNREGIAATSRARQQAIQSLRQQMQAQADLLQSQKSSLGKLYIQGRNIGLDPSELESILQRYREISRELLNLRTMMQNPSSLSFADMMGVGRYTGASSNFIREASQQVGALRTRTHEAASAARDFASAFDRVHNSASRTSSVLSDIKSLFLQGGVVFGIQQIFNSVVKTGGEIEQQHIALQSILGDVSKANDLFDQTKRLALESPFTFGELNRDVKQLAAFGVETDNLYDMTKRLADVAAGLGVSFERLGLAYGQVKSRSWLDGKELRQFAYAGLPMLQKLADYYNETRKDKTYSTRDVRDMITKREVSFADVDAVIKRLTSEGGQFYNLQYVLSETLLGQFNKLKDAWDIMLGQLASGNNLVGKFFKTGIQLATAFVQSVDKLGPVLAAAFSGFAAKKLVGAVGGTVGAGVLSAKDSIAQNLRSRHLLGEQLNASEMRILRTKGMITAKDIEILARSGQITKQDIRRLYITGQINTALYKQSMELSGLAGKTHSLTAYWRAFMMRLHGFSFATFGGALLGSVTKGIGGLAKGLWGLIGGLPGALLTAGTMVAAKIYQSRREMQDAVNRINEEQNARYRSIDDFLSKNPTGKAKGGTGNDRMAAIENYKEKLKEVAPYNVAAFEMSMNERKSHEERIDYLARELKLVRDANDYNSRHSERLTKNTKDDFEDAADGAKELNETYGIIEKLLGRLHIQDVQRALPRMAGNTNTRGLAIELNQAIRNGETLEQIIARIKQEVFSARGSGNYSKSGFVSFASGLFGNGVVDGYGLPNGVDKYIADYYDQAGAFKKTVKQLKESIQKEIPNVGKDPMVTEAYRQFRESLEGQMQLSPEEKEMINISLDEAFGIGNNDLQVRLADKLRDTIDQTIPEIAAKIRSGEELTQADKDKVSELMQTAVSELEVKYPMFSGKLQSLLDSSHFQATIHLAYGGDGWNDLQKRFYNNLPSLQNDRRRSQLSNIASPWTKDNSMYSARNLAKSAIDQARNELKAEQDALKRGKSTQAIVNKKQQDLQDMLDAALYGLGYDYEGELKKSNKPASNKEDTAARKADNEAEKSLRARLQLIKEAYATYQKYYKLLHDEAAAARVVSESYKGRGLSNDDVSKITSRHGYMQLVEDYLTRARSIQYRRPSDMQDRKDADIAAGVEERNSQDYELLTERINAFASAMSRDLDEMSRKWENYQNIYKATGNAQVAASMSGLSRDYNGMDKHGYSNGSRTGFVQSYSDYLRNFLDNLILNSNTPDKSIDYERLMGMSDNDIEKYAGGLFGTDDKGKVEGFVTAFKKLKEIVTDKEFRQALDTFDSLMRQIATQAGLQARNAAEHDENVNNLNMLREQGKISGADYDRARAIEDANYAGKQLEASDEYKRFANNIISMTVEMANGIKNKAIDVLDQKLRAGIITAKDYAEQVASISDKMSELAERQGGLESFLAGGIDSWLEHQREDALSDLQLGAMMLSADPNSKEGMQTYQRGVQKLEQYRTDRAEIKGWDNLNKSIHGAAKAFNNLIGALQPLIDTAETFGNKGIAEGVGIAQKGISGGLGVADSMNGLAGLAKAGGMDELAGVVGKAGVWGAAAGAALGIGSSLVNKFGFGAAANKQYEKQERYYKQMLSTMQDINSNLENRVSASYGSQSIQAARKLVSNYQAQAGEARETFWDWSQAHTLHKNHRNRLYLFGSRGETSDYLSRINGFLRQNGYTGTNVGGDSIQNLDAKWLKLIKEDLPEAWARMNEEAREYLNNIIDAEGDTEKLKEAADKLNEVLTGMTFDGLRQSYASLLGDLSSDNDDFADNFEKTMREAILNSMIANLYKDRIEKAISDTAALAKNEEYVDRHGNVRRHTNRDENGNLTYDEDDIASEYTADEYRQSMAAMEGITDGMAQARDMLKDLYGWSDRNSSSMSSSIQGMTEQTGDLLAAYLNAIRADVSVIRQMDGIYLPKLDITATAQLQQLNMITENTRRNAEAAERINVSVNDVRELLTRVSTGAKEFKVSVK